MTEISVLMAVYNETIDYIKESIESILDQSFSDFEFIIVYDNPKNQFLWSQLEKLVKNEPKIKLLKNEKNIGLALSLNKAFSYSSGNFIARMDADDIALKNRFQIQHNFLKQNRDIALVASNFTYIDSEGKDSGQSKIKIYSEKQMLKTQLKTNILSHPTWFLRREAFESIQGYRNFPTSQDYDFSLRLLASGYKIMVLEERLLKYRVHDSSITTGSSYKQFLISSYIKELYKQRRKNGEDLFSEDKIERLINESKIGAEKFEKGKKKLREGMIEKNLFKVVGSSFYSWNNFLLVKEILLGSINKRRK